MIELDALLERTLALADDGDWPAASELLHDYREEFKDAPAIFCWLGVVERELGNEGTAYDYFKQALAMSPEDPYILATAGNGIAVFDDPDAMEALKSAAVMAPELVLTRLLYGAYLSREGFHEWALEQLLAAHAIDPDDPEVNYELGVAKALAGDVDGGVDALADAVAADPENGWNRTVFGLLLLENDRAEEAVGELAEGARLCPEDIEAQLVAAAAAGAFEHDDIGYEMLERARMRASETDIALVSAVEEQLDSGPEASLQLLTESLAPNALRARLSHRP